MQRLGHCLSLQNDYVQHSNTECFRVDFSPCICDIIISQYHEPDIVTRRYSLKVVDTSDVTHAQVAEAARITPYSLRLTLRVCYAEFLWR